MLKFGYSEQSRRSNFKTWKFSRSNCSLLILWSHKTNDKNPVNRSMEAASSTESLNICCFTMKKTLLDDRDSETSINVETRLIVPHTEDARSFPVSLDSVMAARCTGVRKRELWTRLEHSVARGVGYLPLNGGCDLAEIESSPSTKARRSRSST